MKYFVWLRGDNEILEMETKPLLFKYPKSGDRHPTLSGVRYLGYLLFQVPSFPGILVTGAPGIQVLNWISYHWLSSITVLSSECEIHVVNKDTHEGWFWNLDHHPLITDPADFFLNRPQTHWRWTQRLGSQKRIRWVSPGRRAMLLHLNSLFASLNSNKDRSTWILHYRAFVAAARRKRDHSGSRCHRLFACCYSTGRHCCILEKKIY